jgi:fatty-acid desaturase
VFSTSVYSCEKKVTRCTLAALLVIHLLVLAAPLTFTWAGFALFAVMVVATGMLGITLGYHRLLTHQSFATSRWLQIFFATLGTLALQGGPISWVATHRLHHKTADTNEDPHSPIQGFGWAHLIWNLYSNPKLGTNEELHHLAPDLSRDPAFRYLERNFVLLNSGFALLVFTIGCLLQGWKLGLSLLIWGCAVRTVYVWHITWLVNSATHVWGYRTYDTNDNSRNNWWVALLTFGEGWHNNHHANPQSARMGLAWFELDITYWTIKLLSKIGLATHVIERRTANKLSQTKQYQT